MMSVIQLLSTTQCQLVIAHFVSSCTNLDRTDKNCRFKMTTFEEMRYLAWHWRYVDLSVASWASFLILIILTILMVQRGNVHHKKRSPFHELIWMLFSWFSVRDHIATFRQLWELIHQLSNAVGWQKLPSWCVLMV